MALMQFFGVVSFSVGIPVIAYQLQESMAEQDKFGRTVDITLSVIGIFFVLIGVFGVALFSQAPEGVQSIIISNLSSTSTLCVGVKIVVSIMLLSSIPLSFVPALNMLDGVLGLQPSTVGCPPLRPRGRKTERGVTANHVALDETTTNDYQPHDPYVAYQKRENTNYGTYGGRGYFEKDSWGSDTDSEDRYLDRHPDADSYGGLDHRVEGHNDDKCQRYGIRICVLAVVTLIAIGVPCFTTVMSLLGCVTIGTLSFILPPVFYLRMSQTKMMRASWMTKCMCYAFTIFGIISIAMATIVILVEGRCQ